MPNMTQAQINASEKYRRENIRQILIKVNRKTQPQIYEYLVTIDNMQRYILDLIRADMRSKNIPTDEPKEQTDAEHL